MKLLFIAAAVAEALFGLSFLFLPVMATAPLGIVLDATSTGYVRLFGSALVSFSLLLWLASRSENREFQRATLYTLFTYAFISTILLVLSQLSGQMNNFGWGIVGLHAVYLVLFGLFLLRKQR